MLGNAGMPGEQDWSAIGEALQCPLVLLADQREDLVINGDEGLAFHLGVAVAQVGGAVGVGDGDGDGDGDGAVEGQSDG